MQTLFPQENFSCIVAENIWRTNSLNSLFIVSFRKPIISHLVVFTKKLNQSYIVTLLIPSFRQPKPYRLLFPVNTWHFSLFPCSVLLPTIIQFSFLICYKSVKTINISQWVEMVISVLLLTIHFTSFNFHCIKHPPTTWLANHYWKRYFQTKLLTFFSCAPTSPSLLIQIPFLLFFKAHLFNRGDHFQNDNEQLSSRHKHLCSSPEWVPCSSLFSDK